MPSNYLTSDPIQGQIDLDDKFITDAWLVDQFVGGQLWGCGYNFGGSLGNGASVNYSSPVQIGSLTNWKQVSGGYLASAAIKTDGTLWTWGTNTYGALGNGTTINYSSPIQIGSLTNWKQVSAGDYHMLATKTDGTLWAWGFNNLGQLGNSTVNIYYSSPVQIGSLTNWKEVICGVQHAANGYNAAIKIDGTIWTWGSNLQGQLGNGTTLNYSSPVQVGSLNTWKQVSMGSNGTAGAIKVDGTLWTWGNGSQGRLGNGTTVNYSSPIQVGLLTNWKQVSCSIGAAAIKTDGTLWTWGNGSIAGQTGNGTLDNYSSPIQVGLLTNWKQVSYRYWHMAALKTDGTLWAWGWGNAGALGNGTTVSYSSPIQVGALTNWKYVDASSDRTLAITYKDIG